MRTIFMRSPPLVFKFRLLQTDSDQIKDVLAGLNSRTTTYQYLAVGKRVVDSYLSGDAEFKKNLLVSIATNCGADSVALNNAISIYSKNQNLAHEVREAATPVHFKLLQSIGNLQGGIKQVCDMRANLLVANYESVHPLRGPSDFKKRLGYHRRVFSFKVLLDWHDYKVFFKILIADKVLQCPLESRRLFEFSRCFYFTHEAMPREPLVVVHVALLNDIADNVQSIVDCETLESAEDTCTTAVYYSITATQIGDKFSSLHLSITQ
ncbi:hypothetical protein DICVIV_01144 [Dictyocaulus viviparus]|uniref:Uncharacterized protein n=1 Tax=Dictyocaulus viviparus TaxID=29172 RepID=A0A0D8Y777_DICVI|nr:hypothetical protein DICVIV_01144 [Dictyocaulus viviparus]